MSAAESDAPVVVGIDGSVPSYAAVSWAAREAKLHHCPLRLVSALGAVSPHGDLRLPPRYFADRDRAVHDHLAVAAAIAHTTDTSTTVTEITTDVLEGAERPALIEESKSARMVVVGSRGLGHVSAVLAGSVAVALAAHAHSPVVVIHGQTGQTSGVGNVVVGVDGTENGVPALEAAFTEAALRGTRVVAVHTWSQFAVSSAYCDELDMEWDEVDVAERAVLAEALAGWSERYPEVPVTRAVVRGNAAGTLRDRAVGAELLVVGTRGRGGFEGMVLGSTSATLLHSAQCPIMIVRSGRPADAGRGQ